VGENVKQLTGGIVRAPNGSNASPALAAAVVTPDDAKGSPAAKADPDAKGSEANPDAAKFCPANGSSKKQEWIDESVSG
jgi:hypothetical protein